ncbi:hypothetical protein RM543_15260 [Roseicyclus sp. F158]|uniref:CopG family transcriptional regulator n=1 Tax=Tropicimonas omnivorans TaxID=3075590 RepID=A0ABU3DK06_9RHOB|nr:hypothetical protein [Roseicyclus sp. F158]MDT0684046.1 hypothetical protein [Roseicyclus sp. F158]
MRKARLSVYLEPAVMDALTAYADRRDRSLSLVAEAAIASFVTPDASERLEAALSARLDRLNRTQDRLERDQTIALETLALFVRHWLTVIKAHYALGRFSGSRKQLRKMAVVVVLLTTGYLSIGAFSGFSALLGVTVLLSIYGLFNPAFSMRQTREIEDRRNVS